MWGLRIAVTVGVGVGVPRGGVRGVVLVGDAVAVVVLEVRATPPEATLWVNGEQVGQGYVQIEKMVGHYVVVADLGLYHPERQPVDLTTEGARVNLVLKPAWGGLEVLSDPAGAEVWVDGENVGKTPWKAERKPSGTHEVRVVKPGHLVHAETVQVEDGKTAVVKGTLEINLGALEIVSDPPGARILVDNLDTHRTTPAVLDKLDVGTREIRLQLDGYADAVKTPTVVRNDQVRVEMPLTAKTGVLTVLAVDAEGHPCDGTVQIDGKPSGVTPLKVELPVRTYTVDVSCPEARGSASIAVPHNEKVRLVVSTGGRESRRYWTRPLLWTTAGLGVAAGGCAGVSLWAEKKFLDPETEDRERLQQVSNTTALAAYGLGAGAAAAGLGAVITWRW